MSHHRNTGFDQRADSCRDRPPPFQLHRMGVALLHQAPGMAHSVLDAGAEGEKGHVADHQRAPRPPAHRLQVMHHGLQRHRNGRQVAEHHMAQRIPNQDRIHAGRLRQPRRRKIVGRHEHERLGGAFPHLHVVRGQPAGRGPLATRCSLLVSHGRIIALCRHHNRESSGTTATGCSCRAERPVSRPLHVAAAGL